MFIERDCGLASFAGEESCRNILRQQDLIQMTVGL